MPTIIPASLLAFYRSLPWDNRGLINEIPAGGRDSYGNTHTDRGDPYGPPIAIYNPSPNVDGADKAMTYASPIDDSWVIPLGVPPIGTAVWQIKDNFRIVRTSRIDSYNRLGFIRAKLKSAGPYPGVPIPGDSESLCFVCYQGQWRVLGIVNFAGNVCLPRWTYDLPLEASNSGYLIPANMNPDFPVEYESRYASDWGNLDTDMSSLILPSVPITKRVMGKYTVGDDGTDSVRLFVPHATNNHPPANIQVLGRRNGKPTLDEWRFPDTFHYWHLRAVFSLDGIVLYFKPSQENTEYIVTIDGQTYTCVPGEPVEEPAPEPPPAPWDTEKAALLNRITTLEGQRDTLERRLAVLQTELDTYKRAADALRTLIRP